MDESRTGRPELEEHLSVDGFVKPESAMPFDAYHRWLGIPPEEQPPTLFRLLGVAPTERDRDVIVAAAERQRMHIESEAADSQSEIATRLLAEVHAACEILLDPAKRQVYELGMRQASSSGVRKPAKKRAKPKDAEPLLPLFGASNEYDAPQDDDSQTPEFLRTPPETKPPSKRKPAVAAPVAFEPASSSEPMPASVYRSASSASPSPFVAVAVCMVLGAIAYFMFMHAPSIKEKAPPIGVANRTPANPVVPVEPVPAIPPPGAKVESYVLRTQPKAPPPVIPTLDSSPAVDKPETSEPVSNGPAASDRRKAEPSEDPKPNAIAKQDPAIPSSDEPTQPDPPSVAMEKTAKPKGKGSNNSSDESESGSGGGKDFIRYKGQDMSASAFRKRCAYVDETNFTSFEPESAAFVEVTPGKKIGDIQQLYLMRHGKVTKLTCECNWRSFPRPLKENQPIWAYGWFTDAPTGESVFVEDRGGGRVTNDAPETTFRKRSFLLKATDRVDTRAACKRLNARAEIVGKRGNVEGGQLLEVKVALTNPTNSLFVDAEVQVVISFGAARVLGEHPNRRIVDFDRVPPKTLEPIVQVIQMRNELSAEFIPKAEAVVIHAIEVTE